MPESHINIEEIYQHYIKKICFINSYKYFANKCVRSFILKCRTFKFNTQYQANARKVIKRIKTT